MVPKGPGSKVPSTGPEVTLLVSYMLTSPSGLVYAKKGSVEARVLGLNCLVVVVSGL